MAAFSHQQQHSSGLFDPLFLPNAAIKMSGFLEEPNTNDPNAAFLSEFYPLESLHQGGCPVGLRSHDHQSSSYLENGANKLSAPLTCNNNKNEASALANKHSTDSLSSVVDKAESSGDQEQLTQNSMVTTMAQKRKNSDGSSSSMSSAQCKDARELRGKKQKKCSNGEEKKAKADKKKEEPPTGYIHVRARRGHATDSHSLAERVRREKISERMKQLQALVPGCDKVTGKALMLDEIINYVQSLQHQVEFLSMKLASVNPMFYDFGTDLDAFMDAPETMSSLVPPLPNVQQCNPAQAPAFTDAATSFTIPIGFPLLDTAPSLLFQQQRPDILSQDNGQPLWDVDDQRQRLISQSGFMTNLCSFH